MPGNPYLLAPAISSLIGSSDECLQWFYGVYQIGEP